MTSTIDIPHIPPVSADTEYAQFIQTLRATGAYAAGQTVAFYRWPSGGAFELSGHDVSARLGNRRRYGLPTDQEEAALEALGEA